MRKRHQAEENEVIATPSTNGKPTRRQQRNKKSKGRAEMVSGDRVNQGYESLVTNTAGVRSCDSKVYHSSHHVSDILQSLYDQRDTTHGMCDMVLVAADETFQVHRAVVAAASPFIRSLLIDGVSDGIYSSILLLSEYGSMTSHTLDSIVGYIYKGSIELSSDNVQDIFEAAETLQMEELKGFCQRHIDTRNQTNKVANIYAAVSNEDKNKSTQFGKKQDVGANGHLALEPLTCKYCPRRFSRLDQYKQHKENHEKIYRRHWFGTFPSSNEQYKFQNGQRAYVLDKMISVIQGKDGTNIKSKAEVVLGRRDVDDRGELLIDEKDTVQMESKKKQGANNKKQRFLCLRGCGRSFAREHFYLRHLERDCLNRKQPKSRENPNISYTGQRGQYTCSECQKTFRFKSHVIRHLRNHSAIRPWKCQNCNKSFKRREQLDIHQRTHTGEKPYQCTHCDKRFTHNSNLHAHIRRHFNANIYNCPQCNMLCDSKVKLLSHLRNVHTIEKPYKCLDCGKSYRCESQLKLHTPTHQTARPYKCHQCGKCFKLKYILTAHERHSHTGKTYQCEFCNKAFRWKGYLNIHVRKHTGEKPYGCSRCGERFFYKYKLEKHDKIHTGEVLSRDVAMPVPSTTVVLHPKPDHKCDHCGAGFFEETDLNDHLRTDHMIQTMPKSILGVNFFQDW